MNELIAINDQGSVQVLPSLDPATDSKPAIQSALDWLETINGRKTLIVPPGVWKLGTSVELVSDLDLVLEGVELTPLNPSAFQKALIVAGASTHPDGGGTRSRCDRVSIVGGTLNQTAATSPASVCLFAIECNDWRLRRLTAKNSKHEGLVSGGLSVGWIVDHCLAFNCGSGDSFRAASGAAFNFNGMKHFIVECVADGCTQSFEHGGNDTTFVRCQALNGTAGVQGPSIGFNLGNAVAGLCRTKLIDCKSTGHPAAITVQNGNGRVGGITIDGFDGLNGSVSFAGGKDVNIVPTEWDRPANEPSYILRSKFKFTSPHLGAIGYNPGPSPAYAYAGLAPLYVLNTIVDMTGVPIAFQSAPHFYACGDVALCVFEGCGVVGQDANPSRGDFATFSGGTNLSPTPSGKLLARNCWATKINGSPRFFHTIRETPE